MTTEESPIMQQPCCYTNNKVRQGNPSLDYNDDIIDEKSIKQRFGHKTDEQFHMLMSNAIAFTNRTEKNNEREFLKNCSLHIFENDNFYRQTSGNGKNIIVVNFENDIVVVQTIGFYKDNF